MPRARAPKPKPAATHHLVIADYDPENGQRWAWAEGYNHADATDALDNVGVLGDVVIVSRAHLSRAAVVEHLRQLAALLERSDALVVDSDCEDLETITGLHRLGAAHG